MLSGNKYTSRSSLGSAICLQQIPKEFICFSRLGKNVTNMSFIKGEYFEDFL